MNARRAVVGDGDETVNENRNGQSLADVSTH